MAPATFFATAAYGQTDDPGGAPEPSVPDYRPRLELVTVTATRRELSATEVTAAVTRIPEDALRTVTPSILADALRGQPGAFVQQTTPGQGIPIIRGLKGSQVLHLVDGMRLNNAFFRDAPNQYFALVDPRIGERLEVLRGAAGSLHGSDAMGGVVILDTRSHRFEGESIERVAGLFGRYDSADHGLVAHANAAAGHAGGSLAGAVTWQKRGNRRTGDGETVRPSDFESRAAHLKWIATSSLGEWMIQAQALEQPSTPRVDELVPGFGQDEPAASEFYFEPNRRTFFHARLRGGGDARWWTDWSVNVARQVIVDDRRTRDTGSTLRNLEENESTLDGITFQARALLSPTLDLVWGLEVYRDEVRSSRRLVDIDTGESVEAPGRFPDRATQDIDSIYGQLNWAPTHRLTLEGGLRYGQYETRLPSPSGEDPVRVAPDDVTGDVRLRLAMDDRLQLLANVSRGFRAPNVFDLGALGPRPGNRFNIANPNLEPESVWSYDVGLRGWGSNWQAEAFVFVLDYRDRIASVPTGEITESGRRVVQSENRAEADVYGVEVALNWQLTGTVELEAVVNYSRGTERVGDLPETPGDRIPPLNGRLGVDWTASPDWRVEFWTLFAAEQDRLSPRDRLDPRIDPTGTPGWITLNALAEWRPREELAIGFEFGNVLDESYREHGSGIDAPGRNLGLWFDLAF